MAASYISVPRDLTKVKSIHNHPSGRLMPSREDIAVTDRMLLL